MVPPEVAPEVDPLEAEPLEVELGLPVVPPVVPVGLDPVVPPLHEQGPKAPSASQTCAPFSPSEQAHAMLCPTVQSVPPVEP
jgi:hypothetical protein